VTWDFLRSSYDAVADAYAATFDDELDRKPRDRELLLAFAASAADPVVDLGCGPGHIGRFVHDAGRRVVGIDLSAEMAALASERLDGSMVADMRVLPVASVSLGGIVAFYSLIHIPRPELGSLFRELHRVLRPGGRFLFTAHAGDGVLEVDELLGSPVRFAATLFGLDELVEATTAAGFEVTTAERRPPYPDEHPTDRIAIEAMKAVG
jgi:SAM-dependent methyltransferase